MLFIQMQISTKSMTMDLIRETVQWLYSVPNNSKIIASSY